MVAQYQPRVVALDLSRVSDIEYSALQMLADGIARSEARGVDVWLAALNPGVLEVVRHTELERRLGRERLLFNARTVIARYQQLTTTGG